MRRFAFLAAVAAVLTGVAASVAIPTTARTLCLRDARGPTTTVNLYDRRGGLVATMRGTPCGPLSSVVTVRSKGRVAERDFGFVTLVHGGTCERPRAMPSYRGFGSGLNPRVPARRLSRSSFVVEWKRYGEVAPFACGFHKGDLPLPPTENLAAKWFRRLAPVAGGYVGKDEVRLNSIAGGRRTLFTWVKGIEYYGSSGQGARLRPGTCRRLAVGHEIVLLPDSTTTVINVPLAELARRPFALEILGDLNDSSPYIERCFDF